MKKRQNVQQQNAEMKEAIASAASRFADNDVYTAWVAEAVLKSGLDPSEGILVKFSSMPDQGGECAYATWLTSAGSFFEIKAMIAYGTHKLLEIETLMDVSSEVKISEHLPGVGKSFGALALEVLNEISLD